MQRAEQAMVVASILIASLVGGAEQAPPPEMPVSWTIRVYPTGTAPGAVNAVATFTATKAASLCGQIALPLPPGPQVNPKQIRVSDPADATKDCVLGPDPAVMLTTLPVGTYFAIAVANGPTRTSDPSDPSNTFQRQDVSQPTKPRNFIIR